MNSMIQVLVGLFVQAFDKDAFLKASAGVKDAMGTTARFNNLITRALNDRLLHHTNLDTCVRSKPELALFHHRVSGTQPPAAKFQRRIAILLRPATASWSLARGPSAGPFGYCTQLSTYVSRRWPFTPQVPRRVARSKFVDDPLFYKVNKTKEHPQVKYESLRHLQYFKSYEEHKQLAQHTIDAFAEAQAFVNRFYNGANASDGACLDVVIDSGCGTGVSTRLLAARFPNMPVIGVDRSLTRLSKMDMALLPNNALLLRANLIDFWLLAFREPAWSVNKHFVLYPNPYPKHNDLTLRFHGHPVFPFLVLLGGELVLRSNWEVYLREFRTALRTVVSLPSAQLSSLNCSTDARVLPFWVSPKEVPLTNFERKLSAVGVQLYEFRIDLGRRNLVERRHLLERLGQEANEATLARSGHQVQREEQVLLCSNGV